MSDFIITDAQQIIDQIVPGVTLEKVGGRVFLSWDFGFGPNRRMWNPNEGSHFPRWSDRAPWGGTCCMAIDQVIRHLQGKSVVPHRTWVYLIDGPAKLAQARRTELVAALESWPRKVPCILCGKEIESCGDWWTIGKGKEIGRGKLRSGPSCSMRDCRGGAA